jgi:4-hydroxybenzoate polyprenyltransferase
VIETSDKPAAGAIADAPPGNWVDSRAPESIRPYLRLARADRPIGAWLLFWPCAWSLGLANLAEGRALPNLWHLVLFVVGAFVMRSAGCAWNDVVDREYDAKVERTRLRPIPSGQISVTDALAFGVACSLVGLIVLVQFNRFAIWLGIASLLPVAIYPFMKRITYWPQAVLGLTFKWGALMGWAATFGRLDLPALVLYAACIAWTLGYDTIYAHQDKEDDALVGLRSTALRFGRQTPWWLTLFYALTWAGLVGAGLMAGAGLCFVVAMSVAGLQLAWQVTTLDIDDAANCLDRFRSNHGLGAIIFAGIVADMVLGAPLRSWLY